MHITEYVLIKNTVCNNDQLANGECDFDFWTGHLKCFF